MWVPENVRAAFDSAPRPVRVVVTTVYDTYVAWRDGRTIRLGAALAYYGLFSMASVLTVSLGLSQRIIGAENVESYLNGIFQDTLGPASADASAWVADRLDGSLGTQLGLIGGISLLVTGSLFFLALEDALNQIWLLPVRVGWRISVKRRAVSFLVLFAAALTLVVAFATQAVSGIFNSLLPGSIPGVDLVASLFASALSWVVLWAAVTLLFRYLPAAEVRWRAAIIGGIATSALLIVGTTVIGWYLRTFGASSVSGAMSSVLAILAWIFYEAQIFLVGAQFTRVVSNRIGST